jgi:hypothetical protein
MKIQYLLEPHLNAVYQNMTPFCITSGRVPLGHSILMYCGLSLVDATPTYLVHTTSGNGYLRQPSLLSALSTSIII